MKTIWTKTMQSEKIGMKSIIMESIQKKLYE